MENWLKLDENKPLYDDIELEKVSFQSYEGAFEKISETEYVAKINTHQNDLILDENVGPYSKLSVKTKTRVGSSCSSRFRLLIFGPDSDSKSNLTW